MTKKRMLNIEELINLYKKFGIGFLIESNLVSSENVYGTKLKDIILKVETAFKALEAYLKGIELLVVNEKSNSGDKLSKEKIDEIRHMLTNL